MSGEYLRIIENTALDIILYNVKLGGNIFKLTGSIILYTIVVAFFIALIKGCLS